MEYFKKELIIVYHTLGQSANINQIDLYVHE